MSTAPATRRPLVETARQHHHSRSRGLGPVRTEPDDHAERAARPESRRPPDPYPPSEPEPRPESPASARTQSGRTLPATALADRRGLTGGEVPGPGRARLTAG